MRTLTADAQLATAISRALGHNRTRTIGDHENAACLTLWSVRELQDAYDHIGGTLTARPVTRRYSDGDTAPCIEIVLTADLDGIGSVALVTDWDPAEEAYAWGLPLIKAAYSIDADDSGPYGACEFCGAPANEARTAIPTHRDPCPTRDPRF